MNDDVPFIFPTRKKFRIFFLTQEEAHLTVIMHRLVVLWKIDWLLQGSGSRLMGLFLWKDVVIFRSSAGILLRLSSLRTIISNEGGIVALDSWEIMVCV